MKQSDHDTNVRKIREEGDKHKQFVLSKIKEISLQIKEGTASKRDVQWLKMIQRMGKEATSA